MKNKYLSFLREFSNLPATYDLCHYVLKYCGTGVKAAKYIGIDYTSFMHNIRVPNAQKTRKGGFSATNYRQLVKAYLRIKAIEK